MQFEDLILPSGPHSHSYDTDGLVPVRVERV